MKNQEKNQDQPALIAVSPPPDTEAGTRHRELLEIALTAATEAALIEPIDMALVSIARANAFSLDQAEAMGQKGVYAVSNITGPYREVLQALRMVPQDRNKEADNALAQALAALAAPTVGNPQATSPQN